MKWQTIHFIPCAYLGVRDENYSKKIPFFDTSLLFVSFAIRHNILDIHLKLYAPAFTADSAMRHEPFAFFLIHLDTCGVQVCSSSFLLGD